MHADMDYYLCLCALFPPMRNIIKNWSHNEDLFLQFVKRQGDKGIEHFFQAIILYFVRSKYAKELGKYAAMFLKKLVDEDYISYKFILQWSEKEIQLDKDSCIRDKKAEKKLREGLISDFIDLLK